MKITQEQADWLIENIERSEKSRPSEYETMHHPEGGVFIDNVKKIINQCIEKEFPKFEVGDIFVDVDERDDNMISISFTNTPSSDAYWSITKQGFKQFTEGCNKIVEWLNAEKK